MSALHYLPLIIFCVLLNTAAQILLKVGMKSIGHFDFILQNFWPIFLKIAQNPAIIGGLFLYVLSVGFWMMALSRVDVSYAYPLSSLGYVFTALAGYWFLQENLSATRILGIIVILGGVYLVSKS
tara:strand:- start:845 stop:1219 length:375 start_codon:yes stop_codon:yes gene_type:complete